MPLKFSCLMYSQAEAELASRLGKVLTCLSYEPEATCKPWADFSAVTEESGTLDS